MKLLFAVVFLTTTLSMGPPAPAQELHGGGLTPSIASSLHPGTGEGDFEFYFDAISRAPGMDGRVVVEVLLQVPVKSMLEITRKNHAELDYFGRVYEADAAFAAVRRQAQSLQNSDELSDRKEAERRDWFTQEMLRTFEDLEPLAQTGGSGRVWSESVEGLNDTDYQIFKLSFELPPGEYAVEVVVHNKSRTKRGLLDRLRHRPMSSVARTLLRVPDLHASLALADPEFLVGHGQLQSYATRVYGLLNDSLHVATTVFHQSDTDILFRVRDREGEVHLTDSLRLAGSGSSRVAFHKSVGTLPAGQYLVTLAAETDSLAAVATRSFDVAWSLISWNSLRRDLDTEALTILSEAEYEAYTTLPLGEKERFMREFWRRWDPTPDTTYNERYAEFRQRMSYADIHFSEIGRGALSDRGRIYIRLGAPNEIQHEAVPSHLAGTGTDDLVEKIDDPYTSSDHLILQGNLLGDRATGERLSDERQMRNSHSLVVGRARELTSYELWIYAGGGQPLLPGHEDYSVDSGVRLLFVDTQGFGEYKLRKASSPLDIFGLEVAH